MVDWNWFLGKKDQKLRGVFCSNCLMNEKDLEDITLYRGSLYCFSCYEAFRKEPIS